MITIGGSLRGIWRHERRGTVYTVSGTVWKIREMSEVQEGTLLYLRSKDNILSIKPEISNDIYSELQASTPLQSDDYFVLYSDTERVHSRYARAYREFLDGRFVKVRG